MPTSEPLIRLGVFVGVFLLMTLWEIAAPRRERTVGRAVRWPNNLGIVVIDSLLVRLLMPTAAVGTALHAEAQGWGLLALVQWPAWAEIVVTVVLLDLAIYFQHVLFHAVPALWRLHRMHHADLDFDATTGVRFHPIEILLSLGIKIAVIAALGAPPLAVLIFEIILNATSMFNHGNVRMPAALDRIVRWFVVTPDMHRVHHSIDPAETNSNFGFNFSIWDRMLGTYRTAPGAGHIGMTIGISQFRDVRELWLDRLLTQPFREDSGPQPFNGSRNLLRQRQDNDTSGR
ncbi:MAG: sterol desaturase family protein [Rhizobiales bacterium]|nr:sterol desaturase family protein [Hyphomicrobiales bacterium]